MRKKTEAIPALSGAPEWQPVKLRLTTLPWVHEFVGYALAALAGLAVDSALLVLLVDKLKWEVLPSAALSFTTGALVVYVMAVRIAFCHRKLQNRRVELTLFVAVGCGGLLVTLAVIGLGTQWLSLDYRLTKVAAAGASFLFNFAIRKALLF